jgi:23S rRNA (uracil1939-C5)-methyltransferase
MSRSRRQRGRFPSVPVAATIESLAHDGRGVSRVDGKTVFVDGALPGEHVTFVYTSKHRNFDEGRVEEVTEASPLRAEPRCAHYKVCGGCSLQHLDPAKQIDAKQEILLDNFTRIGRVSPDSVLPPMTGPHWGYRRKARLSVKYVIKKGRVLVGFREKHSSLVTEIERCEVLHPAVGLIVGELAELIGTLHARDRIAQIEVAVADNATALVFRNLDELTGDDLEKLGYFGQQHGIHVYLQPSGPDTVYPLWPVDSCLTYGFDRHDLELEFRPTDFVQINFDINQQMVDRVLTMLNLDPGHRVLDLFCGIGNFTLALAKRAKEVVGVEGDEALVRRAQANAERNHIQNARFYVCNLADDFSGAPWTREHFDAVLLDPPRAGALEVLEQTARFGVKRIVYVSCHPGTLARDAGELVNLYGYRLLEAGVMDMFPHTAHVESIALFEKRK